MDAIWLLTPYLVVICSHIDHAYSDFQPSWLDRMKDRNDYPQCGSVLHITFAVIVDMMHHTGKCFPYHLGPLFYLGHDVWRLTLLSGARMNYTKTKRLQVTGYHQTHWYGATEYYTIESLKCIIAVLRQTSRQERRHVVMVVISTFQFQQEII